MTGDDIRQSFLRFFEERGHKVVPGSSLIPHGDPTLLLTSAGMVQFKPYFLGEATPPCPRLASCQKCFRTTDIEVVGDTTHLTFFEMLGNFSVGDYFKQDAIAWGWQYVTQTLGLPKERLWITIYLDDDEAFEIWRRTGVTEDRILRFGEKENFWGPAGDSGPCGPCSEIHYDFGPQVGCGKPDCDPGCDCGRFSEIWNLVFVQYDQDRAGKRTPLKKCHIDTGMGLERVATIMQGQPSVYETDLFAPLMALVARLSGKEYGRDCDDDNAMRVVAEHGRGITFLIADGVLPSNEGRGYVLRRAALFGRRLGLDKPFLAQIAEATIKKMGHVYPELKDRRSFVLKLIESEEARFGETLSTGLELLDEIIAGSTKEVSGADAFKLYDTYGFPIEMTCEIAAEKGLAVDMAGFEKEMEKQRERAKSAHRFKNKDVADTIDVVIEGVEFVGYDDLKSKATIAAIVTKNTVDSIKEGQKADIVLNKTPFYAEMGGQVGDSGEITGPSGRFVVTDTVYGPSDAVLHRGYVAEGSFNTGDKVEAAVDVERRLDIARNHTATHLLHYALRKVLGEHVHQRGSLVAPDRLRFDFSHLAAMTPQEIDQVEQIVNYEIRRNSPVSPCELSYKEAIEQGAIALFDEKYGDVVRVLSIGQPAVSTELCGGTHVAATGEIGFFHILSESSIGGGLRRMEAVTGNGAEQAVKHQLDELKSELAARQAELKTESGRVRALERDIARERAESLVAEVEEINGINLLAVPVPSTRAETLRDMADVIRDKLKSGIVVLGSIYDDKPFFIAALTPDMVAKGYNAGDIIKKVTAAAGGGGGGKPALAQGSGKDKSKLDEALRLVRSLV